MAQKVLPQKIEYDTPALLEALNRKIASMAYELALVDPKDLKLAKKNARFMKPEKFKSLLSNIKKDGNLCSFPFCYKDEHGTFHVLSGNHRVQAAIQARVDEIFILYRSDLTESERTAIQLSHNAIEGEDDLMILKELWESIEELDLKVYAGVDSDTIRQLEKIQFSSFSEQRLEYKSISFLFLPEEAQKAQSIFKEIESLYGNDEVFIVSTPTTENGQVTRERTSCDVTYHFHVPCPECGAMQLLVFEHIRWPDDLDRESPTYAQEVRESAWYQCPHCDAMIDDYRKPAMIAAGEWRPDRSVTKRHLTLVTRSKGYHLSSLYSPWLTWGDIAEKFIKAKDYPEKLQNFLNSWLAETWVELLYRTGEHEILTHRTDYPALTVPPEALAVTAGFDVQKEGFYYVVRAWARDYTSWLIRYGYVMSWDTVYQIIFEDVYPVHESD